jgi:thiamine biosynthesis lipoprotein
MRYKRFLIQLAMLMGVLLITFIISHTRRKGEYIRLAGFAQGTTYHITYESKNRENLQYFIDSLLADFDLSLSIYQPNSIISRFNRNEPRTLADQKFIYVFNKAYEVYQKTEGAFDITVGPIVNAIGFGSSDTLDVDSTLIRRLLKSVGMNKVSLHHNMLVKQSPDVTLDVNALAQGYSVDLVVEFLEARKIRNYLVEIGGEVRVRGKNENNRAWRIGIDRPVEGNFIPGSDLQAVIRLNNRSLATSGNYRKFYEKNGIKFVHTINPKTGYPVVSNLLSATVVASDCITADAYATALMVFGVDKSIAFLAKNQFLDAFLIYADQKGKFKTFTTERLQKFIEEQ